MAPADMAARFECWITNGGVVVFPSDTVYGLACDPDDAEAIARLYALKRRPPAKASAVMYFDLEAALSALPELGERTRAALGRLMPGAVTALLPNPALRFPLACGADPETLGLRVVFVPVLAGAQVPVMQSSANLAGGAEARRLADVPEVLRAGADLVIDGGELPGVASTVVDLRRYERGLGETWAVIRPGAVSEEQLAEALEGQYHFNPDTYAEMIRGDIPAYAELQATVVAAAGDAKVRRILELGTGTGETAKRLLGRFEEAQLVGIDESPAMLEVAVAGLPAERVELSVGRLQDRLPEGRFDVVASALCVHHLDEAEKQDLFRRVRERLVEGGRFALGDVVIPSDASLVRAELTPGYDKPSTVEDQLRWLREAGFDPEVIWQRDDLAVIAATATA